MQKPTSSVVTIVVLFLFALPASCSKPREVEFSRVEILMDTLVKVTIRGGKETDIDAAFDQMRRVEDVMTRFSATSELSQINAAAGKGTTPISAMMSEALTDALHVAEKSDGAFEPTIGPLVELWSQKRDSPPTESELEETNKHVGWRKIKLTADGKISLEPGMSLNLDAIAKGYVVNRALNALRQRGCKAAIITAGGDIGCYSAAGYPAWRISVEDANTGTPGPILELRQGGVATSGIGRRFNIIAGVKYCHILDPKTMRPITGNITTAGAWAQSTAVADAWATAAMVRGRGIFAAADSEMVGITLGSRDGKWVFNRAWENRLPDRVPAESFSRPDKP